MAGELDGPSRAWPPAPPAGSLVPERVDRVEAGRFRGGPDTEEQATPTETTTPETAATAAPRSAKSGIRSPRQPRISQPKNMPNKPP